jgi:hypothetical protein
LGERPHQPKARSYVCSNSSPTPRACRTPEPVRRVRPS